MSSSHPSPSRPVPSSRPGRWGDDEIPLPPPPFARQVIGDLWESLFTLVMWTLAMLVLGLPAFLASMISLPLGLLVAACTVAPALAGLMVSCSKAARGGFARLGDAWTGTLHLYGRSTVLALPLALFVGLAWMTAGIVNANQGRFELVLAWAFQIGVVLLLGVMHLYLFPILALLDTPLRQTVGLAALLITRHVWQSLLLVVVGVLLLASPSIHPLVALFIPGVWSVVVVNAAWRMLKPILAELGADESGAIDK